MAIFNDVSRTELFNANADFLSGQGMPLAASEVGHGELSIKTQDIQLQLQLTNSQDVLRVIHAISQIETAKAGDVKVQKEKTNMSSFFTTLFCKRPETKDTEPHTMFKEYRS